MKNTIILTIIILILVIAGMLVGYRKGIEETQLTQIDSIVYKNGQLEVHTTSYKTKYYMYYKDSTLQFIKADKSGGLGFYIKE